MSDTTIRATRLGPAVFVLTLVAILAFFWWFLLYRHGAPVLH